MQILIFRCLNWLLLGRSMPRFIYIFLIFVIFREIFAQKYLLLKSHIFDIGYLIGRSMARFGRRSLKTIIIVGQKSGLLLVRSHRSLSSPRTQCQDEFRNLSGCVIKILTGGRILQIAIAWCQIDGEIHSSPTMYGKGWGYMW